MNKLFHKFIFMAILILIFTQPLFAQGQKIGVFVNGLPVKFDVAPIEQKARVLVPYRAVATALNVEVSWDSGTQTLNTLDKENHIRLVIGKRVAYRNSEAIKLDVAPQIIKGRVLIPLRFLTETLGWKVVWDSKLYTAKITSAAKRMDVLGFYALGDQKTSSWNNLFGTSFPQTAPGNTDLVNKLALGWYSLDAAGNLLTNSSTGWQRPSGWEKVLAAANAYHLETQMVIHTENEQDMLSFLKNENAMNKAISQIANEAQLYNGVNLNIETLGWKEKGSDLLAVRNAFTKFVTLLSQQLKQESHSLTLTLHPLNGAYKGYDYQALGKIADEIVVMAYGYGSKPEPDERVAEAIVLAQKAVPSNKLLLGISANSETVESITNKFAIAKKANIKGIAIWRLGLVNQDMWKKLREDL